MIYSVSRWWETVDLSKHVSMRYFTPLLVQWRAPRERAEGGLTSACEG